MKKITSVVISVCLMLSAIAFGIVFSSADSGAVPEQYKEQGKTLTALTEKWNALKALKCADTYTTDPNYTTVPYAAGELSADTQNYATAYLNFARYLANVPIINLNAEGARIAQAGALVNRVNDDLSHTPPKPAGMDQTLYNDGLAGAGTSNMAWGYSSLNDAIGGWLNDTDMYNIEELGHRTNFLSPALPYTGFGKADKYYAGIALPLDKSADRSKFFSDLSNFRGTVMCPAPGYFPIQALPNGYYGGAAWSIQFDNTYNLGASNIAVTVNNRTKNEIISLTESDQNVNGKYLSKSAAYASSLGVISFRVSSAALVVGDEYTITVSGIKDHADITYDVKIIDMENLPSPSEESSESSETSQDESSESEEPIIPTMKGDTDGNNEITTADALLALRIIAGNASASTEQLWAMRVEADDTAPPTTNDVLLILKKSLGLIDDFPCE